MAEKKQIPQLQQGSGTFDIVVPKEVEAKIRHLCSQVHDVEWSGTLFYKVEGTFEEKNFKVICLDIFVMDIGSSGYTEYRESEDVIGYRCEHPELLEQGVFEGLIHSHNNMATFFSGTDTGTLNTEGNDTNHFVSLIVNNAGTYTARVTRKIERKVHAVFTEDRQYHTYNNEVKVISTGEQSEKDFDTCFIEWFELKVSKESVESNFEELDARLNEIRKAKQSKAVGYRGYQGGYQGYCQGVYRAPATPSTPTNGTPTSKVVNTPAKNLITQETTPAPKSEAKQLNLFNEEAFEDGEEVPVCLVADFDANLLESLVLQLITGSAIINNASKLDKEKWVKQMDTLYDKRFGDLSVPENKRRFKNWAEMHIEFLIYECDPELEAEGLDEADMSEVCAFDMIEALLDLPDSAVKEEFINILKSYIPNGAEEYLSDYKPE